MTENFTSPNQITKKFKVTDELSVIHRADRMPKVIPATGAKVFAKYSNVILTLGKAVMTDHISITYATNEMNYYVKIYVQDVLKLDLLENKISCMLEKKIEIPGVCWPIDIIVDNQKIFVGVLLPISEGIQLTRSVLNGANGLSQCFPKWNRQDLCKLTITLLDSIMEIHNSGLLFGCLNPASIYIKNENSVYFVDVDCWQVEGYPALSQNQTFTPPERLKQSTDQLLYTMDEENYQIAVLTFMILMPGKFPYAKRKSADRKESIINMAFPFSMGGEMRKSEDAERPAGIWRIVWDHLPYTICEAFYNTFHYGGKYSVPGSRLKAIDWNKLVKNYGRSLEKNNTVDSNRTFPKTFRRDIKRTFVICDICGEEHPDFYFLHSIRVQQEKVDIWQRGYKVCIPCARDQSDMSFECECCGRQFYYTNRTKILHEIGINEFNFKKQRWCWKCKNQTIRCTRCGQEVPLYRIKEFEDRRRNMKLNVCQNCFTDLIEQAKQEQVEWRNSVAKWERCRCCGRNFPITNGEMSFYKRKEYILPMRCPSCRRDKN